MKAFLRIKSSFSKNDVLILTFGKVKMRVFFQELAILMDFFTTVVRIVTGKVFSIFINRTFRFYSKLSANINWYCKVKVRVFFQELAIASNYSHDGGQHDEKWKLFYESKV